MKEYLIDALKKFGIVVLVCAVIFGIGALRSRQPRECPRCGLKQTEFTDCPFCDQKICTSCAEDYEIYAAEYLEDHGYTVIYP